VGCCPAGVECSGTVNEDTTVTVTVTGVATALTTTPAKLTPAAPNLPQDQVVTVTTTTTQNGGVFLGPGSTSTQRVITGACSTLTMNGNGLPTLFPHYCSPGVAIVQAGAVRLEISSLALVLLSLFVCLWRSLA
jgi:hypothetical protein